MLDNFDPQEKKVILIFIALLLLGLVYVGTHDLQFGPPQQPYVTPLPDKEASSSSRYL
ncbi:MAG: hypothetical protein VYD14_06255 [SAR324 cluster bacterium]|jgi:hypothetical protein|uniref:Uncharacterized protein n=1 Tax=marine metagenome TaxID=408172 RepID=A0A381QZL2_9ZZZZ|nr:hypothetical protein [SAR324 cluster bacterium]MDG2064368.1 hypothetical protein [SAR324 cluster bacterium]MDP6209706.1 hypothetical protein [SAR324 cluster bacterium]MDP6295400.1 hypothetical protein [SAR324 cluster bacterium]MDP6307435.1 hypothetical protein [SAR324 cluster bacterium]|tara:strand:- start:766 stop:939 length:174 start_codon:yes stop_codon:yes gene_type:complete